MNGAISIIIAYLLGSLPFGYLAGRLLKQEDIRNYGSGNIGATNVLRLLGPAVALPVMALDMGKGAAAVGLARHLAGPGQEYFWWLAALAALVGHCWPLFLGFKGGKGTATSLGAMFVLVKAPIWGTVLLLALVVIFLTRYVSLVSILGAASFPLLLWIFKYPVSQILIGMVIAALIIFRHRANIGRLIKGTESKLGKKASMGK